MTPKEKAKELILKYSKGKDEYGWNLCECDSCAKKCALIAVDEILWEIIKYADNSKEYVTENTNYWEEVKQEIELL
jgi:hypothetical protein